MLKRLCYAIIFLLFFVDMEAMSLFTQAFDYIVKQASYSDNAQQPQQQQIINPNNNNIVSHPFFNQQQIPISMNNGAVFVPMNKNINQFQNNNNNAFVKTACISPDGSRLARIIKSGNQERLVVRMAPNTDRLYLQSAFPIEKMAFVGSRYVVCVIEDSNYSVPIGMVSKGFKHQGFKYLKLIDLDDGGPGIRAADIRPTVNATEINIFPSKISEALCTISYNGSRYFTHLIDVKTGQFQLIVEGNIPPVLDKNLQPRIYYKVSTSVLGITTGIDVFAIPEGGTSANAVLIDHINDDAKEIYVSIAGNICYKLILQNDNSLLIRTFNIANGSIADIGLINGVSSFGNCHVNLDTEGNLLFVTIGSGNQRQNFPCSGSIAQYLTMINNKFGGVSWYGESCTADNYIWVLCACSQPNNRYFLYDLRNNAMQEIHINGITTPIINNPIINPNNNMLINNTSAQLPLQIQSIQTPLQVQTIQTPI
ncbi:MAG: hypothetical protein IJT36_00235 [Alphaproteobacteria bacterium]|nr:hypothetical protein [Alphaproteobacteria bacterium]